MSPLNWPLILAAPSNVLTPVQEGPLHFILTKILCDVPQSLQVNPDIMPLLHFLIPSLCVVQKRPPYLT
jgi:hypothetical protein